MGIDPFEFRRMNALKIGKRNPLVWSLKNGLLLNFVTPCDRTMREQKKMRKRGIRRVGKSSGAWEWPADSFGIGYCAEASQMAIELDPDDGVTIYAAVADPGEGNDSMLAQIAAHQLGLPLEKVRLYTRNTDKTVGMGPAAGSRMTFAAGQCVIDSDRKPAESNERS